MAERSQVELLDVPAGELEEELLDPDEGLELRSEVETELKRSLDTPREDLLSPEKAWSKLGVD